MLSHVVSSIFLNIKKKVVLFLLVIPMTCFSESPLTYLYVNQNPNFSYGMFSVFNFVAGVLYEYDKNPHLYSGIEINFEKFGLYYDEIYGPNWWQYYCEPIQIKKKIKKKQIVVQKRFDTWTDYYPHVYLVENELSRQQVNGVIKKYIKVKKKIEQKVSRFVQENFNGYHIISVHYRGTDKIAEAPRIPFEMVETYVRDYINENGIQHYKIFIATDEWGFIDFLETCFPGHILIYSTIHSNEGKPIHTTSEDHYLQGEEALIDCLLLSKGNVLMRTSSNLSLWSTYFNPSLPVIEISKRY